MDTCSRRIMDWSIGSVQVLVRRARATSTFNQFNKQLLRQPIEPSQFTNWSWTERVRETGLMSSVDGVTVAILVVFGHPFW